MSRHVRLDQKLDPGFSGLWAYVERAQHQARARAQARSSSRSLIDSHLMVERIRLLRAQAYEIYHQAYFDPELFLYKSW